MYSMSKSFENLSKITTLPCTDVLGTINGGETFTAKKKKTERGLKGACIFTQTWVTVH